MFLALGPLTVITLCGKYERNLCIQYAGYYYCGFTLFNMSEQKHTCKESLLHLVLVWKPVGELLSTNWKLITMFALTTLQCTTKRSFGHLSGVTSFFGSGKGNGRGVGFLVPSGVTILQLWAHHPPAYSTWLLNRTPTKTCLTKVCTSQTLIRGLRMADCPVLQRCPSGCLRHRIRGLRMADCPVLQRCPSGCLRHRVRGLSL